MRYPDDQRPGAVNHSPHGPAPVSLSVVIPMFREARRIGDTLADVIATLAEKQIAAEIITVDDGSTDDTARVAERVAAEHLPAGSRIVHRPLRHDRNRGKGAAVRTGLSVARAPWVLMMDADNSARLAEIEKLADRAQHTGAGLIVGSRATPDAIVHAAPSRKASGLIFRAALGLLGMGFVRDTQCGFKLYRRDAARLCAEKGTEDGFAFDLEHIGLCRRAGLGVEEVGIRWEHRDGGTVNVLTDGPMMLARAIRIRRRLRSIQPLPTAEHPGAPGLVELKPIGAAAHADTARGAADTASPEPAASAAGGVSR